MEIDPRFVVSAGELADVWYTTFHMAMKEQFAAYCIKNSQYPSSPGEASIREFYETAVKLANSTVSLMKESNKLAIRNSL